MPALSNTFLFVEPQKHYLNYGSVVLHRIVEENKQPQQTIVELIGDDANKEKIRQTMETLNPITFVGLGHGNVNVFSVECTEKYITVGDPEISQFKDRVVSLCSCFPPDTSIMCNPSTKKISDCTNQDKVLTHKGRFKSIRKIYHRSFDGDLVVITPRKLLLPTKLTPEHPVLAIKAVKCKATGICLPKRKLVRCNQGICAENKIVAECTRCKYRWISEKNAKYRSCPKCHCRLTKIIEDAHKPWELYKPQWIEAKDLTKDHLIIHPIITDTFNVEKIYITDYWSSRVPKKYMKSITNQVISEIEGKNLSYSKIAAICKRMGRTEGLAYHVQKRLSGKIRGFSDHVRWESIDGKIVDKCKHLEIPNEVKVSPEFMEICGLYVAEGHTDNGTIQLSFGSHEVDLANRAKDLFFEVFGLRASIICCPKVSARLVRAYCQPVAQFFRTTFGLNALTKRLPSWFLTLPKEKQRCFFNGYHEGDGYVDSRNVMLMNTASKTLALQLVQILLRQGKIPTLRYDKNSKSKNGIYEIQFVKNSRIGLIQEDKLILPIRCISKERYKGDVCNLEIEDDNSYVAEALTVHNCLTAVNLGPAIMDAGAVVYTGYKTEFWFYIGDDAGTTRAVNSPFLAEFQFVGSLLQGKTAGDARADQLLKYDEEINYWISGDGKNQTDAMELSRILEMNKTNSVFLGEGSVNPSPRVSVLASGISSILMFPLGLLAVGYFIYNELR